MLLNLVPLKPQIVVGLFRKEILSSPTLVVSLKKGIESAIIKNFYSTRHHCRRGRREHREEGIEGGDHRIREKNILIPLAQEKSSKPCSNNFSMIPQERIKTQSIHTNGFPSSYTEFEQY